MKLLLSWLWDRQPRIVDFIAIAVIAAVLATLIIAMADGGGQAAKSSASSASTSPLTTTVVQTTTTPPARQTPHPTQSVQAFHAPDGNISCSLESKSAECSVASADLTFFIPQDGGDAYTMPGLFVSRNSGSEAVFGTERSDGSIVCNVPPENVPAGVTCRDTASAHGFEASRVPSRRHVY